MAKNIPAKKFAKAAASGGKLGKRARLAETLKGMHPGGSKPGGPVQAEKHTPVKTDRGDFKFREPISSARPGKD